MALEVILAPVKRVKAILCLQRTAYGIGWVIILSLVCASLTLLFDWATPLPPTARLVLSILSFIAVLYVFVKLIVLPFLKPLSDDRAALVLEEKHPELKDALISSIQLARYREDEGFFNSEELVQLTLRDTAEKVKHLRLRRVVDITTLFKVWLLAALFMFGSALYITHYNDVVRLWFQRFFTPFSAPEWPKYHRLKIVEPPKVIAKGDDLEIVVLSIGKKHPDVVTVYSKNEKQDYWESSSMQKHGKARFVKKFENVVEPMILYVEGGDARAPENDYIRIDVRTRPFVKRIALWLRFPEYTGLQNTPREEPLERGSVSVLEGTEIEFEVTASQKLKSAELANITNLEGDNIFSDAELIDGVKFRGKFKAVKSTSYYFKLTDTEGFDNFTNHKPETYSLRVVRDRLPDVKFETPGRSLRMSAKGVLPMRIRVRDDFGIKEVKLVHYTQKEQEKHIKTEPKSITFDKKSFEGKEEAIIELEFDIEKRTGAKPGEEVVYYAQANDFCDMHGKPSESNYFRITIVTDEELEGDYTRRIARMRERLLEVLKKQHIVRDAVSALGEELLSEKCTVDERVKKSLLNYETDQRDITNRLKLCEEDVRTVLDGMRMNRMGKRESLQFLQNIADKLGGLADTDSPEAAKRINALRKEPSGNLELRFADITVIQDEIIRKIKEIVDLATEWATLTEFIHRLKSLIDSAKKIKKDMQDVLKPK